MTAIYEVDAAGMPTGADVIAALREATLEQAAYRIESGQESGISTGVRQASIGSASVTWGGSGSSDGSVNGLGEQAWQILQDAGLAGIGPMTV